MVDSYSVSKVLQCPSDSKERFIRGQGQEAAYGLTYKLRKLFMD